MSYYRLYFMNSENRISRFVELFHDRDDEAIEDARTHAAGAAMELWNQDRFVARLTADGSVSQADVQVPAA